MTKLPEVRTNPHMPHKLKNTVKMRALTKRVVESIEKQGLSIEDACALEGIPRATYFRWKQEALEDLEDGFTGTNLQEFIFNVVKADKKLLGRLNERMWDKVDEGDVRIMMYLADNRFGYANKRKSTVEIGSQGNKGATTINIVNMTGVESDDNEEIDVYGECGDDSDSTEMD